MTTPWPNATFNKAQVRSNTNVSTISARDIMAKHYVFQAKFCAGFAMVSLGQTLGSIAVSTAPSDRETGAQFSVQLTDFVLTSWDLLGTCILILGIGIACAGGIYFPHQKRVSEIVRSQKPRTLWPVYLIIAIYAAVLLALMSWSYYLQNAEVISRATRKLFTASIGASNTVMFVLLGLHQAKKLMALVIDETANLPPLIDPTHLPSMRHSG
jgi:uncharacterized membrane protein YidH (DUF202 family)